MRLFSVKVQQMGAFSVMSAFVILSVKFPTSYVLATSYLHTYSGAHKTCTLRLSDSVRHGTAASDGSISDLLNELSLSIQE